MIDLIFYFGTDIIFIRVRNNSIMFANSSQGNQWCPIDGLRLSELGVKKEFPELQNEPNWKEKAIQKFKDKITDMKNETEICEYLIKDLKKYGYQPYIWKEAGHRGRKLI